MSAAFSAIMTTGEAVLPDVMRGIIEAWTMCSPSINAHAAGADWMENGGGNVTHNLK